MPRPKLKTVSTIKPKGFAMIPGSKNIDSPGAFSLNNTNTISSLNPDPKLKKEGKAKKTITRSGRTTTTTTTQRVAGAGKKGGFTSGTGYDLDEVIVGLDTDSSSRTNALKKKKKRKKTYKQKYGTTRAGDALRGITRGVGDVGEFIGDTVKDINLYDNPIVRTIDNTIRKRPKGKGIR